MVECDIPSYCALLGHQPSLSLAELLVLLPDLKVQKEWNKQTITFESKTEITPELFEHIGGTVLIAKEVKTRSQKTALEDIIPSMLQAELKENKPTRQGGGRKATFSFRCLNVSRSAIRTLYRQCKLHLKDQGLPSRYIGNERNPAKPGTLLLRGIPGPNACELVILSSKNKKDQWIGKTIVVQDIEAYTERDTGKPYRDTKTGLLPPKLAQIMLNLSQLATGERDWQKITVWDPFCGSGVIALESLHRRAHILSSDKSEKAVNGCKQNIRWLRQKEKTPKAVTAHVFKHNAHKSITPPKAPTVIVTETSLGPPLKSPTTKTDLKKLLRDAEELEKGFFEMLAEHFPSLPVICTFPVYVTRDGSRHFLPKILDTAKKLGYRLTCVSNENITLTKRHTLLYLRPGQYVGREVVILLPPR